MINAPRFAPERVREIKKMGKELAYFIQSGVALLQLTFIIAARLSVGPSRAGIYAN